MKKQRVFRQDALDGLEVRLAPSTADPGAWSAAQVASIGATVSQDRPEPTHVQGLELR